MTDWLKILKEQKQEGDRVRREVPKMLANPDITVEQVKALFQALEKQAEFVEKLKAALEGLGHDFDVVDVAGRLEDRYVNLAASAAERLKSMRK